VGNDYLEKLDLAEILIENEEEDPLVPLGNVLKRNKVLKQLAISMPMSERGTMAILDGLKHHRKLQLQIINDENMSRAQKDAVVSYN